MLSGPLINVLFSVNFNEGHSIWINCWRICIFRKEYWFFILNGYQLTAHKPHYDQLISFAFSIQTKPSNLYGNSIPATAHIIRLCVSTTCFLIVASEIDHSASYIRTKIRPYDCTKRVCVCVYACSERAADTTFTNTKSFVSVALDVSLLPAFGAFAHIRPRFTFVEITAKTFVVQSIDITRLLCVSYLSYRVRVLVLLRLEQLQSVKLS